MSDDGHIVEGRCFPHPQCSFPEKGFSNLGCMEAIPGREAEGHMWEACLGQDEGTDCYLNTTGILLRGQCGAGPSWGWLQGPYSSHLGCVWDGQISPGAEVPNGLQLPPPPAQVAKLRDATQMEEAALVACRSELGEGDNCSFKWREGTVQGLCYTWGKR